MYIEIIIVKYPVFCVANHQLDRNQSVFNLPIVIEAWQKCIDDTAVKIIQ